MRSANALIALLFTLAFSTLAQTQVQTQASTSLLQLTPNQHAAAIREALEADQPDQAYLHARAWQRSAPDQIPPLTALVSAYLAFDAPAAALETIEAALLLGPDPAETRRLQALKIQTLAELGQQPAAWANARDYLRTAEPNDPFTPIISELQWSQFATYAATPIDRVQTRLQATGRAPTLPADEIPNYLFETFTTLRADLANAFASKSDENLRASGDALIRFLLRSHYIQDPKNPDQPLRLLYDYPDLARGLTDLTGLSMDFPAADSLSQWAPQKNPREPYSTDPGHVRTPREPPFEEADAFIATTEPKLTQALRELNALLSSTENASGTTAIEAALSQLLAFKAKTLFQLESDIRYESARVQAFNDYMGYESTEYIDTFNTWIDTLASDPAIVQLDALLAPDSLPRRLADAYTADAASDPNDPLAPVAKWESQPSPAQILTRINKIATPALEDFDLAIASGLMTPALWAKRLTAAQAIGAPSEILWSTYESLAQQPVALAAWLEPIITENDQSIARAQATLANGTDEEQAAAILDLQDALTLDPGHLSGLETLYTHFVSTEQDPYADSILETLWRLSPNHFKVPDSALALATRTNNWPLLLSLADDRVRRNESDVTAHLHRQIAALALGLTGVVIDSTPALNGTLYRHEARILHALAVPLAKQNGHTVHSAITGLAHTVELLGIDTIDPVALLTIALGPRHEKTGELFAGDPEQLASFASPETQAHLDYIAGKTTPTDYLAAHRGTPQEATANFIHNLLFDRKYPDRTYATNLAKLAHNPDLPLFFRAKAASCDPLLQPTPLRVSDPYYIGDSARQWAHAWKNLLPGQKLVPFATIQLPEQSGQHPVIRLSNAVGNPHVFLPKGAALNARLLELDGIIVDSTKDWTIAPGHLAAITHGLIQSSTIAGEGGSLWLESSDLYTTTATLQTLIQSDVLMTRSALYIKDNWAAHNLRSNESIADLKAPNTTAQLDDSLFLNHDYQLFNPAPSSRIQISDTRFYTKKPIGLFPDTATFEESRLVGIAQPELANASGLTQTALNLTGPADFTPATTAELYEALKSVATGQRIDLPSANYLLTNNRLNIPAGVVLRGLAQNGATLTAPAARNINLINLESGDTWLENLVLTNEAYKDANGRSYFDKQPHRNALYAEFGSRSLLHNIRFPKWYQSDSSERIAIIAQGAEIVLNSPLPARIKFDRGRLDHLSYDNGNTSITGPGAATFSHYKNRSYSLPSKNFTFSGPPSFAANLNFAGGGDDPRTRARIQSARDFLETTLAQYSKILPRQFDQAPDIDARLQIVDTLAKRLAPLVVASQLNVNQAANAYATHLNAAFAARPDELPFYLDLIYFHNRGLPDKIWQRAAHVKTFSEANQARLSSHLDAIADNYKKFKRNFTTAERDTLIAFSRRFPVGSPYHERAMAAFARGEDPSILAATVAREEELERQRLAYQAQLELQRQRQLEQQRRDAEAQALARNNPPKKSWWETYSSQYPNGRYTSSSNVSKASASQNMSNYRRQLNDKIYNTGRDYGKQYKF